MHKAGYSGGARLVLHVASSSCHHKLESNDLSLAFRFLVLLALHQALPNNAAPVQSTNFVTDDVCFCCHD